jgi:hypothetical protein
MYTYKLLKSPDGQELSTVKRSDGMFIPFDPDNTDYQAFLKYQEEGGKVYGADEEVPDGQTPQ